MAIGIKCPVCGETTQGNFCEHCGFEIHVYPNPMTPEMVAYEQEREKRYSAVLNDKDTQLHTATDTAQKEIENITENARKEKEELEESHKRELEKLRNDLTSAASDDAAQKDGIIREKDETIKKKDEEITRLNAQIATLSTRVKELETNKQTNIDEINRLKKEIERLNNDLEEANKKTVSLDGIVRVIRKEGDNIIEEKFLPVFKGENFYGTGVVNKTNYHIIPMKRCGIQENHFSVTRNSSNQMVIKPQNGALTCNSNPVPAEGQAVEVYDVIKIGDEIEIRIDCYL